MQNLKHRRQLSSGLIMLDQKHRINATACDKRYVVVFVALIIAILVVR